MQKESIEEYGKTLEKHADNADFLSSFARGLMIFEVLSTSKRAQTISDIAKETGFPRATVRRGLFTLVELGYVLQDDRYYELSPKVLMIAHDYINSQTLSTTAQPILENLTRELNETATMGVLVKDEVIYIARSSDNRQKIMSNTLTIGSHLPAYCSSIGRVLLAAESKERQIEILAQSNLIPYTDRTIYDRDQLLEELEKVHREGYSIIDQELEVGLRSISVPVFDRSGKVIASISISALTLKYSIDELISKCLPALQKAAAILTTFI
ncbi:MULTISPECIES: IclR family transcriptional regulator domain-containing protein [Ignatzschineria]|nr:MULTISPECIES: IclR family transcriptional regulator C-terminal domain-containing protein [Ignatzschineria]